MIKTLIIFLLFVSSTASAIEFNNMNIGGNMALGPADAVQPPSNDKTFDMTNAANFFNIMGDTPRSGYRETNAFARAIFTTTTTSMNITGYTNYPYGTGGNGMLGIRVNGSDLQTVQFTGQGFETFNVTLPGGSQTVEIINGSQQYHSPIQGSYVSSVTFVGDTSAALSSPSLTGRIITFGDSISVGSGVTNPPLDTWPVVIRENWATGDTMSYGQGAIRLATYCSSAATCQSLANILTGEFSGITTKIIWLCPGSNDWSGSLSLSTFQTNYALLLDYIHANDPDIDVYAQSPVDRVSEATPNSNGDILEDFRDAISTVCAARSSYCTYVDGKEILSHPSDFQADGIHPSTAAQSTYATYVETTLGI